MSEATIRDRVDRSGVVRQIGVTGASGFLGGYIIRYLLETERYAIRALSRSAEKLGSAPAALTWERGDLTSAHDCESFVRDVDAVVHLAHANTPLSSHRDWASDALLNVLPTLNLIEALRRRQRRIDLVFASSGGALYGAGPAGTPYKEGDPARPTSPYGVVKLAIEHYLRLAAAEGWLRVIVLRMGNPYGRLLSPHRRQGLIGVAMRQVLRGEPVPIYGDPRNVRDYIHLSDVAAVIERSLNPPQPFAIYNIGSGRGATTEEVLALLERIVGHTVPRQLLGEVDNADRLVRWVVLDIARAQRELGWRPAVSLEVGVERMYRKYRHAGAQALQEDGSSA